MIDTYKAWKSQCLNSFSKFIDTSFTRQATHVKQALSIQICVIMEQTFCLSVPGMQMDDVHEILWYLLQGVSWIFLVDVWFLIWMISTQVQISEKCYDENAHVRNIPFFFYSHVCEKNGYAT
jgi:hypothetical protein